MEERVRSVLDAADYKEGTRMSKVADCCMCDNKMEIIVRNPWGDMHLICRDCHPKFVKHFWPNED